MKESKRKKPHHPRKPVLSSCILLDLRILNSISECDYALAKTFKIRFQILCSHYYHCIVINIPDMGNLCQFSVLVVYYYDDVREAFTVYIPLCANSRLHLNEKLAEIKYRMHFTST